MGDIMKEVYGVMQCKECPWYKSCATPMRFSAEDLKNQMQSAPGMNLGIDPGMQNLISGMATAAQNSLLESCPVFVERLRSSPRLAQKIKQLMQEWGSEA